MELTPGEIQARNQRVKEKASKAIESLAARDMAAAASVLRVGRIEVVDQGVETAALQLEQGFAEQRFKIVLGAEFCDRPQRDVEALLLHELLHHVMRHLEEKPLGANRLTCNVVQDAFINRTIDAASPDLAQFMAEYYDPQEMPCALLRPDSTPEEGEDIYKALYQGELTEAELYRFLEGVSPEEMQKVKLLGGHEEEEEKPLSEGQVQKVLEELAEQLERTGNHAGLWKDRLKQVRQLQAARKQQTLEEAFKKALCSQLGGSWGREGAEDGESRRVLMPERPHRADIYWSLAGMEPLLWRCPEHKGRGGCAVYLDVSGSMNKVIELVYSSCLALQEMLGPEIYLFSNQVAQIDIDQLREGLIDSTYGTDFSCVGEHLLERPDLEKAVIFTDGYAAMPKETAEALQKSGQEMIGVLTPDGSDTQMGFCSELFRMPQAWQAGQK